MQNLLAQITAAIGTTLPRLVAALLILIVGWIVARIIAGGVRRLLQRTDLDNRTAKAIGQERATDIEG